MRKVESPKDVMGYMGEKFPKSEQGRRNIEDSVPEDEDNQSHELVTIITSRRLKQRIVEQKLCGVVSEERDVTNRYNAKNDYVD